jgi:DUF4097 and DUF4098 domain-containing protein YvlB
MMIRSLLTTITLTAFFLPAMPAGAQVYPHRIRTLTRTVVEGRDVERYQGSRRQTETERITKTVRLGESGEIQVSNLAGDIAVTRGSGNEVTIEAVKTGRGQTAEEARQALQHVEVDIVERSGRVEIQTRYSRTADESRRGHRESSGSVAYSITAPEHARITANSISGDLSVTGIKGDVSLETISGDVRVASAGRVTQAKTASGDVEITDTTIEGTMDAATISGTMTLRNVKARRLDVGSVSGDVVLQNVDCERLDAQSVSGDVEMTGPLVKGGRYDLGSHSGEIRVTISGNVGFELDASSFSGSVRTDLEQFKITSTSGGNRGRQRSVSGTFGDASAFLDLTTFSGSIIIGRQ